MKKSGSAVSLAAVASSIASLACCLPFGFAGALGAAGASAVFRTLRPWLLVLSVTLLALGFWQNRRAAQCSVKGRAIGQVALWVAVVIVVAMILFPQTIAAFLADHLGKSAP